MEALGTLVEDKICSTAASIFTFRSSGSAAATGADCAQAWVGIVGLIASNAKVRKGTRVTRGEFGMLASIVRGACQEDEVRKTKCGDPAFAVFVLIQATV
jgi:hypothetical protein